MLPILNHYVVIYNENGIMKKYIFITKEGITLAPNVDIEVENLQVIGIIDNAINEDDALKKLLQENPWIWESGFNVGEFICYELVSTKV
jgi:hypothetical protein